MLTDTRISKAKKQVKTYTLNDNDGLCVEITPKGKKYWRYRYTFNSKRNRLSLGVYSAVSLAQARKKRDEYKSMVANDINPSLTKQEESKSKVLSFGD